MLETQPTKRLRWLLWFMLAWTLTIVVRLMWLQVVKHDELVRLAQQQQQKTVEIPAARGTIFDRAGRPLAKTLPAESIVVNPLKIPDPGMAADLLSRILDLDRRTVLNKIVAAKLRKSGFLWVKRKATSDEVVRVKSLKLDWVEFRAETRRAYPHGRLAAHVLGSTGMVNQEDTVEHGSAGLELSFDEELSGRPGLARVYKDVRQNAYDMQVTRSPEPGVNLTLTIDSNLQYDAEQALEAAAIRANARTGSLVVLNPYTGDVLAMANYPTFDPNVPPRHGEPLGSRANLAVATPYEPGSVFKVITLAAALETTNLTPDTMINCGNGIIKLAGRVIHDHDRYAALSMADVLAKSSNIGAIQVGLKVGEAKLYEYVRKFGFGRKTGIDLPGESAGILRRLRDWEPSSIGSVAMGHEIGATSIQLALAGAVVANGGLMVKPRLVLKRQKTGGVETIAPQEKPERVIAPETAIKMRQMMEGVVLRGTGKRAALKGYTSGGKTGSAQIYDFKARAYTHTYNASFLGFAPVNNPQIVVAVTLVGTSGGSAGFGGPVAAPVFRAVATPALRMLDVPKDLPETTTLLGSASASARNNENDLAIAGLGGAPAGTLESAHAVTPVREQAVSSVTISPPVHGGSSAARSRESVNGSPLDRRPFFSARSTAAPVMEAAVVSRGTGPRVPDFRGMTLRGVLEESAATRLPVEVIGSGMARNQDPLPGSALAPGMRVRVLLAR